MWTYVGVWPLKVCVPKLFYRRTIFCCMFSRCVCVCVFITTEAEVEAGGAGGGGRAASVFVARERELSWRRRSFPPSHECASDMTKSVLANVVVIHSSLVRTRPLPSRLESSGSIHGDNILEWVFYWYHMWACYVFLRAP